MKNVQVIDSADNCFYDIYEATDEAFNFIFPEPGQDIEFAEDLHARIIPGGKEYDRLIKPMWDRRVDKKIVQGIHGTLFYELEEKRRFYPNKIDRENNGKVTKDWDDPKWDKYDNHRNKDS